ncbi:cytochrome P450 [Streptomyces lividans]|uniref:Cytochrome P450 n=2 Tax=Streptomyces lividans TaxID=1916 RepID=A0ABN4E2S1_STRLI|nr:MULTISPECIES: cytochrome P450 [Streptomyces]QSJ13498.1 cytochrome P450 [Streptomyces lividans]AIJ17884.1 cytochrome P450 [Streptomyces lividans TK24]EFD71375.1 cytochrome P450 [Streptomyces lividans TK24]EOY45266.1 putative cytochrome P450 hydroxylase [Streptomyces lividans 1326]KKD12102.1 cytochrome P450 [Streptomyces sp. WM6391]
MSTAQQVPDILSPEFAANPYPAYRTMRDSAPLIRHEATQSWIVSRYEDVKRVFKDRAGQFTTENYDWQIEPVHGRTILQLSGREHAVRRALVAPAFRGADLQERFLPVIERNSRELIDAFRHTGRADLVADYATRFPVNVIADMLGLDKADHDRFHGWYTSVIAFLGNLSGDQEVAAAGARTRTEFAEYMIPVIRERRENPGDDLLSTLCAAEVDGVRMSDEDIKAFCSLLLAAGGETTDKAIAGIFANLLAHPEQLAAVREDRSLVPRAFAETLRYTPPVHMIMRQTATDVTLSGGTIPAGATVTCLIGAANRDETRYRDPDRFDIMRDDLTTTTAFSAAADHLAFALGRHFCVGALLAKAEVEIGVGQLLDALPGLRTEDGFEVVERGVFTRGPQSLPVRFTPAA